MPSILFVTADGAHHTADSPTDCTLMDLAVMNGVPGILGDCGGSASCGTCHVIVEDRFADVVGPITAVEESVLEGRHDRVGGSRLGCQLTVTDAFDGLVVHLPASQY
jgi:2Fe-2S ferredoxin